jgi:iron complex transport system substrate-binding protein
VRFLASVIPAKAPPMSSSPAPGKESAGSGFARTRRRRSAKPTGARWGWFAARHPLPEPCGSTLPRGGRGFFTPMLNLLLLLCAAAGPAHAAPPQRIVSLNLCADQLVVLLAEPSRIAALSKLARDRQLSYVARQAENFPSAQPNAESVLAYRPDLVLAGKLAAAPTVNFLKSKGVPVLQISLLSSFDGIREQTRSVGKALGAEARAEQLIAVMDKILAAEDASDIPATRRPVALSWQPGGFTAGSGTLMDAVLRAAGYDNLATLRGLKGYGFLTLETVAAGRPDLLIADTDLPDPPSLRQALLAHPVLSPARGGVGARIAAPPALTACAGPFTAEAVALLRAKRRELKL